MKVSRLNNNFHAIGVVLRPTRLTNPMYGVDFIGTLAASTPYALPDTTPIISNAAFQLLAFAIERSGKAKCNATSFESILSASFLQPLNMTNSGLLNSSSEADVFGGAFKSKDIGEPACVYVQTAVQNSL